MRKTNIPVIPPLERLTVTIDDVCALLSVGRAAVRRLVEEGKLTSRKIAGRRVYPVADVRRLIEAPELGAGRPMARRSLRHR